MIYFKPVSLLERVESRAESMDDENYIFQGIFFGHMLEDRVTSQLQ